MPRSFVILPSRSLTVARRFTTFTSVEKVASWARNVNARRKNSRRIRRPIGFIVSLGVRTLTTATRLYSAGARANIMVMTALLAVLFLFFAPAADYPKRYTERITIT